MSSRDIFTPSELKFFSEAIESAAENAARAISQMARSEVGVSLAAVRVLGAERLDAIVGEPEAPVVAVRMLLYGGLTGEVFFLLPERDSQALITILREAVFGTAGTEKLAFGREEDFSVLEETSNIIAGAYLSTLHDIFGLNLYHGTPSLRVDMYLSLIDESIAREMQSMSCALLIENKFSLKGKDISTYLLLVPASRSVEILQQALKKAMKKTRES